MGLSEKRTKNLMERIKAQSQRGYTIDRKAPRKQRTKFVLPMNAPSLQPKQNEKPVLPVSKKQPPQQNKTENVLDPTGQKQLQREKKAEQKKYTSKMAKNDSNATSKSKTNKDIGRKESNQHKCLFSYTEQE